MIEQGYIYWPHNILLFSIFAAFTGIHLLIYRWHRSSTGSSDIRNNPYLAKPEALPAWVIMSKAILLCDVAFWWDPADLWKTQTIVCVYMTNTQKEPSCILKMLSICLLSAFILLSCFLFYSRHGFLFCFIFVFSTKKRCNLIQGGPCIDPLKRCRDQWQCRTWNGLSENQVIGNGFHVIYLHVN